MLTGDVVLTPAGKSTVIRVADNIMVVTATGDRRCFAMNEVMPASHWYYRPYVASPRKVGWQNIGSVVQDEIGFIRKYNALTNNHEMRTAASDYLLREGFKQYAGGARITYVKPGARTVVKISHATAACNLVELQFARKNSMGIPVAPCRLLDIQGVPCLEMERLARVYGPHRPATLDQLTNLARKYPWVRLVDTAQVGRARDGVLLAYDVSDYYHMVLHEV